MEWYYSEDDRQIGPFSEKEFRGLVGEGKVGATTLVWHTDLADWTAFEQLADELFPPNAVESGSLGAIALPKPKNFNYAGFWIRSQAYVLDGMLLFAVSMVVQYLAILPSIADFSDLTDIDQAMNFYYFYFGLNMTIPLLYEGLMVGKYGATLGKMVLGLRVVRPDGGNVGYPLAFARYFAKMLSGLVLGLGYLMAGFDSEKRGLHDMICSTRVIKKRK